MMLTVTSADDTDVRAFDQGQGPVILIVHPGFSTGESWGKVAARLADQFRVVRIVRRHYRLDLTLPSPYSMDREVDDVIALARAVGEPVVIVGHSSGGVVALEALAASPATFAGAVLFEPPITLDPPSSAEASAEASTEASTEASAEASAEPVGEAFDRARSAVTVGQPGKAMQVFIRDVVGLPAPHAWLVRLIVTVSPKLRALVPRQLTDLDGVGFRLDAYARITTPVVLLGGERSPAHLGARLDALAAALPNARRVSMPRRDHDAQVKAPGEVAEVIGGLAREVFG
jgi:pimeloyl-ACP methyl ester carboxylesterase